MLTPEEVSELNRRQIEGIDFGHGYRTKVHPYTCPGNSPECKHHRNLVATPEKWICMCGRYEQNYRQDYVLKNE